MSQENVEIVQVQIERFSTTGEASPETAAVDIAWHDPPDFPDAQVHIGIDGAIHALARLGERLERLADQARGLHRRG